MKKMTPEEISAINTAVAEALREALPPLLARIDSLNDRLDAVCRDYQGIVSKMANERSLN
jgi:hypothetical protein